MKTLLIITANDPNDPLQNLARKGKDIQRLLNSAARKNYDVALIPETTTEDIVKELNVPNRQVEVLHYTGHANGSSLRLSDTDAEATALAEKLRAYPSLKCVFLNGCATRGQVEFFHAVGIPFVLATARPVEDNKAYWLATQLYQYLSLGRSLRQAFKEVVADNALQKKGVEFANGRGILRISDMPTTDSFAWGLYTKDDSEDYYLPMRPSTQTREDSVRHSVFLQKMILTLHTHNSPLSKDYKKTIAEIEDMGSTSDKTIISDLLKVLPYPLGIRLRQINGIALTEDNADDYYRQLLYDYAFFFETQLHYTATLLLSQIWQNKTKVAPQSAEKMNLIRPFMTQNRLTNSLVDYASVIRLALETLQISGIENATPKVAAVLNYLDSEAFEAACAFFDVQKSYYWRQVRFTENEAIEHCYAAQMHLTEGFKSFGFVIENVLASVRGINVINFRHVDKVFASSVSQLVANEDGGTRQQRDLNPMENKSVLCFASSDFDASTASLNLLPFFIDRNVFAKQAGTEVDLYQFIGFFNDAMTNDLSVKKVNNPCFYFVSLKNPEKIWRFNELEAIQADLTHIDEIVDETRRQNHLLANAGELKAYLTKFKEFFIKN